MIIIFSTKYAAAFAKLFLYGVAALIALKIFMEYWVFFVGLIVVIFVIMVVKATKSMPAEEEPLILPELVTVVNSKTTSDPEELSRAQNLLRVFRESEKIVGESKNIETVDVQFGIMMHIGGELANSTLAELVDFQRYFVNDFNPNELYRTAAKRFIVKQAAEISQLKTKSGKSRRINKIEATINKLQNMPLEVKTYSKELLWELLQADAR